MGANFKTSDGCDIKATFHQAINTKSSYIGGCDSQADGTLFFTDFNEKRLFVHSDAANDFEITTSPNACYDLTVFEDANSTSVAATSGGDKVISIIDISSRTVKERIDVDYKCWGITNNDRTLLVSAEGHGIISINLTTEETAIVVKCNMPPYCYIACYNDKLYYTNTKEQSVTCCDLTGITIWQFRDKNLLAYPFGISLDNDGRLYVVDTENTNVIVISANGRHGKMLITKEGHKGKNPLVLSVDKGTGRLLVCFIETGVANVYELKR